MQLDLKYVDAEFVVLIKKLRSLLTEQNLQIAFECPFHEKLLKTVIIMTLLRARYQINQGQECQVNLMEQRYRKEFDLIHQKYQISHLTALRDALLTQ